ncbi:hypothetical protein MGU_11165 [Metarhizium guizhouense ARSEF 977]|uniref:Uncharacterized protein n=1 Tax=Metarhizium guizhouense (strain ARSEF 977) TaxID=1276136 RepID=A0A0B4GP22_METGA|nr:hypothetical protein MGU_11165 [Metarhizium guizhouense ARSEF 977]
MLSFQFSHTNVFGDQVQAWRDGSWIRFNKTWGLEGWLASPIAWDRRDVMVILYVFCRLDNAVEDMWIDSQIKHRRTILGLRGSEFCWAKRGDPGREILHTDDQEITSTWRDRARDALKEAEYQSMQSYGYCGELSFLRLLCARAQLWHRGSIRCHVCMVYGWSEACYLHDMTTCTLRKESRLANALLAEWEGLAGADGGEREQCDSCRFPISVCRLGHGYNDNWASCDGLRCEGVTVIKRVVAALMTVADGSIGDGVVEEDEIASKKASYVTYEKFFRQWLAEQIQTRGGEMPRIVNLFHRLLDGFEGLRQAGWGEEGV